MTGPPAWVAGALREPVVAARRARWGFRHETWIVDLANGRRTVVQRRVDGSDPTDDASRATRDLVRRAGLPTPEPTRRLAGHGPPGIVVELPYVDAAVGAELLGTGEGAATVGRLCGTIAARLAATDFQDVALPDTWASGERLQAGVGSWLAGLQVPVAPATRAAVLAALERARPVLEAGTPGLAHGDLAPVNVLVRDGMVAAVLDLERAQLAHRVYDAAWFAWVLSFHHRDVADVALEAFADAAGLPEAQAGLRGLWPLLLLERLSEAADGAERRQWAGRLEAYAGNG